MQVRDAALLISLERGPFSVAVRCLFSTTLLPSLLPNSAAPAAGEGHQSSVSLCSVQGICTH